jgi:hypothetical protein
MNPPSEAFLEAYNDTIENIRALDTYIEDNREMLFTGKILSGISKGKPFCNKFRIFLLCRKKNLQEEMKLELKKLKQMDKMLFKYTKQQTERNALGVVAN